METALNVLFENNPVPMYVYDRETLGILASNGSARIQYGYSEEEFTELNLVDLQREDVRHRFPAQTKSHPQRYRRVGLWPHQRKDKSELIVEVVTSDVMWKGREARLVMALDVTAQSRTEAEARRIEASLEIAQRIAGLGSWELDLDKRDPDGSYALWWSNEVYHILGLSPTTVKSQRQTFFNLVHPEDREMVYTAIDAAITQGEVYSMRFRIVRPDGELRWVRELAQIEIDPVTLRWKFFGTIQDITLEVHREQEINNLNQNLEKLVKDRTARLQEAVAELESFSYSVSHDLRAPLRAIDGFSLALEEDYGEQLDSTGKHYLDRIRKAVARMDAIIDDLLRLGRINRSELRRHKVDVTSMANRILDELRRLEPERTVQTTVAPNLTVHADQSLLLHAMENLIRNSWKFTTITPSPFIEIGQIETEFGPTLFIKDNGVGFDMENSGKLFKPFTRLHGPAEFEGTGVGLAIVHRVISRHKGHIWAESQLGMGSTFFFTLYSPDSPNETHPSA